VNIAGDLSGQETNTPCFAAILNDKILNAFRKAHQDLKDMKAVAQTAPEKMGLNPQLRWIDSQNSIHRDKFAKVIQAIRDTPFQRPRTSMTHQARQVAVSLCSSDPERVWYYWEVRTLLYLWHMSGVDCTPLVKELQDPQMRETFHRVLVGAWSYNRMSLVPDYIFNADPKSSCLPKCDMLNPRHLDLGQELQYSRPCCGFDNQLCMENEGPCVLDSDCFGNLMCGTDNCIWGSGNCCTDWSTNWLESNLKQLSMSL
jgi:hypothetical protein